MSKQLLPPPQAEVCLTRSYLSRGVKGGTVIAEDVWDRETHRQKLLDPDDYRAYIGDCRNCGCGKVHALCFRIRLLCPAETGKPIEEVEIRLYRCPTKGCSAVYTVLPAFAARHLWRDWQTVEDVGRGKREAPRSTRRRWRGRLASSAKQLVQLFKATLQGTVNWLSSLTEDLTREGFIRAIELSGAISPSNVFAQIAAWIHRIQPGVRLM